MAGLILDDLNVAQVIDFTEAVFVESFVMAGNHVDTVLPRVYAAMAELSPDRETWGTLPHQRESAKAAEDMFAAGPRSE